jgi:DNA-3-methyladenine glycosylase
VTRTGRPLGKEFYARDTARVARDLLGCYLVSTIGGRRTAGRIVEVEAYIGPHDPAAHGFGNRRSERNQSMFGPPGTAYVYRSYGIHWCVNAVTERDGYPAAVLIRALEPAVGLGVMAARRGRDERRLLCAGPGRLCQALGITRAQDGASLSRGPLRITRTVEFRPPAVAISGRVGISKAVDWPLRFTSAAG